MNQKDAMEFLMRTVENAGKTLLEITNYLNEHPERFNGQAYKDLAEILGNCADVGKRTFTEWVVEDNA